MSTPANTWSSGRQPGLYIDTSIIQTLNASGETSLSPNSRLPNDIVPSFLVSESPSASEKRPVSPLTKSFKGPPTGSHKEGHSRRAEVRKLLGHVLNQLSHRTMPPTVYDTFDVYGNGKSSAVGDFVKSTIKGGGNFRSTEHVLEDEDGTDVFSTDETFELMVQLRDVLTMARAQGWKMFDDGAPEDRERYRESGARSSSPFRRSLSSLQPIGRRSRSPSPAFGKQDRDPGLLAKCISILSSIVLEDCRFKVASPRPTRPPNALQAMTLEVARFLLYTHRHSPSTISDIAFALIPAFATFPYEICGRLLAFFEECVVRNALAELRLFQGLDSNSLVEEMSEKMDRMAPGAISIQVDEAPDEGSSGTDSSWAQWSTVLSTTLALRSSNAPMQQRISHLLSSFVKPLLAAALERFEMTTEPHSRGDVTYRLHRLVTVIVDLKFDAYLDILEVLAYHTSNAKRPAAHLLATFWPKAIGHVAISRPPVGPIAEITNGRLFQHSSQSHQFVPWRFGCNRSSTPTSAQEHKCNICTHDIEGFGLFCSLCMCSVHLGCYKFPEGNLFLNHSSKSSQKTKRATLYRFSTIPCRESRERRRDKHCLKPVNLFTLTVCSVCREPLWGCRAQGVHCINCLQFVHASCTTSSSFTVCEVTSGSDSPTSVNISWSSLRQTCMKFYADALSLNPGGLRLKSFEDISSISGTLWTQVQLLENGVTHGTLVVDGAAPRSTDYTTQEFELHHVLFWCTELISSGTLAPSPGTMDYVQYNSIQRQDDSLFFDWSYLIFVSAAIKMPLEPTGNASGGLLPVASPVDSGSVEPRGEDVTHPFEIAPLSHLRDVLGREFYFHCDIAAIFMLSHLHHMGFIERLDSEPLLFEDGNKHTLCTFPLPLGLDVSSDVETLFAAVEASLSDLDLFVNEVGWLLLNRRLWPSGSASEYALGRLMRSILMWILAEDEDLATILRDYLAKQLPLPGVRSINDPAPWPPVHGTRHAPSASVNNGGDYVASRRALVNRYAIPWLAALHNQDSDKYAAILYDICNEVVDNTSQFTWETLQHPEKDPDKYEKILRLMLRVSHNSIMFSASEALFVRWLRDMGSSRGTPPSLPSLTRIFQREPDSSQRYSILDGSVLLSDALRFEPWSLVADTASESGEGLQISLQWLRIFASSGISIPYITLEQMVNLVGQSEDAALDFTHILLLTAWQRSPDRERVQKLVATLHSRMHVSFIKSLQKRVEPTQSITILKRSLAVCLLLYGCDREKIVASGLISEGEMKDLPSRRKSSYQVPAMVDPIVIDPSLMVILEAYMSANNDTISCIIGRFLNCFLMDSPYLEAHEVDNFILRNGRMLCNSAFLFYGIQRQELFALRFGFLLRVVVVDTQPFRELLENLFGSEGDWEFRLAAVRKLFRLILDIKVPAQTVEGRQWRSSITDVFYFFFGSLWRDEKQEIRVAVEILCSTLLPSHFEEISLCWTELFATSPVEERLKLAAFLVQLRSQFPSWQVLSWNVILEILAEDHFDQEASNKRDGALSSHLSMYGLTATEEDGNSLSPQGMNNEMTSLRVSILLLSLDMVANGILVDHNDLLRIKLHVARVFGFDDVHAVPAPNGLTFLVKFGKLVSVPQYAIPCISQLLPLLDSPHPAPLISIEPPRGNTTPLLVGAVFIDVLLGLFSSAKEITSLPILSVKSLLESLSVVIYKHNFENIYIRHLQPSLKQAVTLTLELMLEDINYECRQLALYVTQAYIRKFHGTMRSLIHYALEQVAKLVISQSHTTQDPFLDQARSFLENTLQTYSSNGIFVGLIRRKLDRGIFVVLKQVLDANAKEKHGGESLREYLLRDTLPRAVESDRHVFQDVLNNLQTYVEDVHHQNYSKEFMMFVGQHLTLLARRISEWTPDFVSPGPLLNIAAILMQHNKAQSREMLSYTETVLRVALTRLTVDTPTLSRLVHVTSALYKRSDQQGTNIIIMVLFEILSDGLRMKSRVLSETIGALAQTIMTTHAAGVPLTRCYNNLFVGLAGPGLHFLFNHPWGDTRSEKDLKVSLVVAKMVFATVSESDMIAVMAEQGNEKLGRQSMSMRGWNVLVLAMLMEGSESWWDLMFSQLGALSVAHHAALKSYTHPNGTITESAIPDINHAYIAIKLWLMLAQKKSTRIGAGDDFALKVWEHLWPPFEALLSAFAPEVQAGLPMTLALLVWSTVADLFVFVRNLRSSVTLHTSSQLLILEGLKSLGTGSDAQVGKLSRAIRSLNEPPSYLSNEAMIDQVAKDIIATEKLRELDVLSREAAKMIPERRGIRQEYSQGPN
ncbi:hypothetical protein E1B28_008832 [Marasmius oreades]|uniref:Phorbol-ester/DAG-type domain-containing protein n=1 Tax=Marasmius oreades TaxID=181124 RepID=A0A9P7USS3_9AGAR|nr:uncharacterized protein E1B28_008832 [Marasmius oreades]KAG7092480.1 hypothetical protein E1B28_008832 [Marasmius oreades]